MYVFAGVQVFFDLKFHRQGNSFFSGVRIQILNPLPQGPMRPNSIHNRHFGAKADTIRVHGPLYPKPL